MAETFSLPFPVIAVEVIAITKTLHFANDLGLPPIVLEGDSKITIDALATTACYGNNAAQFPSSNLFASAGEGIWDNGAACGRQYLVRCISAAHPRTCIPGQTIQIRIVDRALSSVSRPSRHGATIVLSKTAFGMIAKPSASSINIEFQ
ncbi:hypothetical protein SO802_003403, partial [Lithocarpus litseifolius]